MYFCRTLTGRFNWLHKKRVLHITILCIENLGAIHKIIIIEMLYDATVRASAAGDTHINSLAPP